ncbi:hypothetical protein ACNO5E_17175 [Vibrio parahaemolyticus]
MNQALQLNPTQVREQAIEKGIIVDYSILGKKAGFLRLCSCIINLPRLGISALVN